MRNSQIALPYYSLVIFIFLSQVACAQSKFNYKILGKTTVDQQPIVGDTVHINISVYDSSRVSQPARYYTAVTDINGNYLMQDSFPLGFLLSSKISWANCFNKTEDETYSYLNPSSKNPVEQDFNCNLDSTSHTLFITGKILNNNAAYEKLFLLCYTYDPISFNYIPGDTATTFSNLTGDYSFYKKFTEPKSGYFKIFAEHNPEYVDWSDFQTNDTMYINLSYSDTVSHNTSIESDTSIILNKIAPNPFHNSLMLHTTNISSDPIEVNIYSISGINVFSKTYNQVNANNDITINLANIAKGSYFISLKSNKQLITRKIMKQ